MKFERRRCERWNRGSFFVRGIRTSAGLLWTGAPLWLQKTGERMSKRELIDAIRQHNRTAAPEFLALFAETELKAYLDRVNTIRTERQVRVSTAVDSKQQLMVS